MKFAQLASPRQLMPGWIMRRHLARNKISGKLFADALPSMKVMNCYNQELRKYHHELTPRELDEELRLLLKEKGHLGTQQAFLAGPECWSEKVHIPQTGQRKKL